LAIEQANKEAQSVLTHKRFV